MNFYNNIHITGVQFLTGGCWLAHVHMFTIWYVWYAGKSEKWFCIL